MRSLALVCVLASWASQFGTALAKSPQQLASEAPAHYAAWAARAALAHEKGMPRLSDPADAALIRAVFDVDQLRGIGPVAGSDTPHLIDACSPASNVVKSYLFWSKDGAPANSVENETLFAPELSLGDAYVITCFGYAADAVRLFTASLAPGQLNEARRQGAVQAQAGILQMLMGIGMTLNRPNYSPEQKLMIASALEDAVPKLANWSTKEGKAVIASTLAALSATAADPSVKATLERALAQIKGSE
jgi:hypothetical protein